MTEINIYYIFFHFKIIPFLPNIAKLRLICLQNKSGFNKLGLIAYISVINHTGSFKLAVLEFFFLSFGHAMQHVGS